MSINKQRDDYKKYIERKLAAKMYGYTRKMEEENLENIKKLPIKEELAKLHSVKDIYETVYLTPPKLRPESNWVAILLKKINNRIEKLKNNS